MSQSKKSVLSFSASAIAGVSLFSLFVFPTASTASTESSSVETASVSSADFSKDTASPASSEADLYTVPGLTSGSFIPSHCTEPTTDILDFCGVGKPPIAWVGERYEFNTKPTGPRSGLVVSVTRGSLPPGLELDSYLGRVQGVVALETPNSLYRFQLTVSGGGTDVVKDYLIIVRNR